jgi:DMSO/TMAO reductase YedYZ molybdopterin-dependent catalytic subunit
MDNRRQFIKRITGLFSGLTILSGILPPFLKSLYGKESDILLAGEYIDSSSARIFERKIQIKPLESFGVMGKTDIQVEKDEWSLEIISKGGNYIKYTYNEILNIPSLEKKAVLTCPGFFENHGLWKGFSLGSILEKNGLAESVKKVEISGLNGRKIKSAQFPLKSVLNDRVFLAYGVNRKILPVRNGFPLRVVAQKYSGAHWVKYVNKITLI